MEKVNILYINATSELGGADICLLDIIRKINKDRYNPIIILPDKGVLTEEFDRSRAEVIFIKNMSVLKGTYNPIYNLYYLINFLHTINKIRLLIRERDISIVHTNSSVVLGGGIAAKLERVPSVWHIREIIVSHIIIRQILNRVIYKLADKIITITDTVKNVFPNNYRNNKEIKTIYDGIDLDIFNLDVPKNKFREEFSIDPRTFLVGMFARMVPWKGHRDFIKAAEIVNKNYTNVNFIIAGDIVFRKHLAYKKALKEMVKKYSLEDKIIFIGNQTDIPNIMNDLDCLVLPSINPEPSGRVILEAMAMAKPVISTDQGGPRELISNENVGILVPPRDPFSIAKAIVYLLNNPQEVQKMGQLARLRIEEFFNLNKQIKEIEKIYEDLLRN